MGSTLGTIRQLFIDQIGVDEVVDGSDPSPTLLNGYINEAIRTIARRDRPRELMTATPINGDIVINTNTVAVPVTILIPESVYYKDSSGKFRELKQYDYKDLIQIEGSQNFFDSTNTGNPIYYAIQGTSLVFNKYFSRSEASAIKIIGIRPPTTLSLIADPTELPIDYDILIVYEAATLYAQRDDDSEAMQRWMILSQQKRAELRITLQTNNNRTIQLDPNVFTSRTTSIGNPSVFFGS